MWKKILDLCKEGYIIRILSIYGGIYIRLTYDKHSSYRVIPDDFIDDEDIFIREIEVLKQTLKDYIERQRENDSTGDV